MIGYNFNIDDGTDSKFSTYDRHTNGFDECVGQLQRRLKEHTVLNILKYEYCVNKSRDHFAKNCKLLTN